MAYRTSLHESTGFTPFFLLHGRDPVLPMDTLLRPKFKYLGEDYVPCMLQRLSHAYATAQQNLVDAREKNKRRLNHKSSLPEYKVGDAVFYFDKAVRPGETAKFSLLWKPYFRVISQTSPVNYRIRNQLTGKERLVHAENLRLAHPEHIWDVPRDQPEYIDKGFDQLDQQQAPTRVQPVRRTKISGLNATAPLAMSFKDYDVLPPRKRRRVSIDSPNQPPLAEATSVPTPSVHADVLPQAPSNMPFDKDNPPEDQEMEISDQSRDDTEMDISEQARTRKHQADDEVFDDSSKRKRIARVQATLPHRFGVLKLPIDYLRSYMNF